MTIPTSQLITMPEGKTLELKCDISSPRNILKTLVAFANTAGGQRGSRRLAGTKAAQPRTLNRLKLVTAVMCRADG